MRQGGEELAMFGRQFRQICKRKDRIKGQCGERLTLRKCSRCDNGAKKRQVRRRRLGESRSLNLNRKSGVSERVECIVYDGERAEARRARDMTGPYDEKG